jgi:hypothetical protein
MKAINEALEFLLKGLITWCQAAAAPAESARAILSITETDARTARLMAVWLSSATLTILLQAPVFRAFGIEWSEMGFLLPYVLILSLNMLLTAIMVQFAFRLFGVISNLFDTLAIFTMTIGVYWPVSTLLALPEQAQFMSVLRTIKPLDLSFWDWIQRYQDESTKGGPLNEAMFVILPIGFVFALGSFAIFGECVVQQFRNPRFKTLFALRSASR